MNYGFGATFVADAKLEKRQIMVAKEKKIQMQKYKLGSYAHNFERIELESPGCSGFEKLSISIKT